MKVRPEVKKQVGEFKIGFKVYADPGPQGRSRNSPRENTCPRHFVSRCERCNSATTADEFDDRVASSPGKLKPAHADNRI